MRFLLIVHFLFSGLQNTGDARKTIVNFLKAGTSNEKAGFLAEDYRSYFNDEANAGDTKQAFLTVIKNWDESLHPDISIFKIIQFKDDWEVSFLEKNDFSKLIGYPGWRAKMRITVDATGLIKKTIYIPDAANKSYKIWLQPAIDWLKINYPNDLLSVYQNDQLVRTPEAAIKWCHLLKQWVQNRKR